jgi:hypothetical protein
MNAFPDEPAAAPEIATADSPPAAVAEAEAEPKAVAETAQPGVPEDSPPRNLLLYTVFGFLCIGVAVWLIFAFTGYKDKYSQQTEGWHLGGTKMLEITIIREDKKNLACASDRDFSGVRCGYRANGQPVGTPEGDAHILQPFNTVKNELFLAAGLWQAPALKEPLPKERFTVVCNYHVVGVLKAVSLRWSLTGSFGPVEQSVAVGTLSDCVIPQ